MNVMADDPVMVRTFDDSVVIALVQCGHLLGSAGGEELHEARFEVTPVPAYPSVLEDLAIVVPEELPAARVADLIYQAGGCLLVSVAMFDVYRGDQISEGKKSLAYNLTYQAEDRTLTDREVRKLRQRIVRRLEETHGLELAYEDALVEEIAARCTEVESGARNVDNILTNTLLPDLSRVLLQAMVDGEIPKSIEVGIGESGDFKYSHG